MVKFLKKDRTVSQNLVTGALSYTTDYTKPFRLQQIILRASVAITEDITITLDNGKGESYDTILRKKSLSSEKNFVYKPDGESDFQPGDNIRAQCTNANTTGTVYLTIKARELN